MRPTASSKQQIRNSARCLGAVAALVALLAFASVAQAAPETIAEFGTGAGEVRYPRGVAVDRSGGEFYIADGNNFRIDKFDAAGNFLLAWGYGVRDGTTLVLQTCGPEASPPTARCFNGLYSGNERPDAIYPYAVAVDSSSGAVYVADQVRPHVSKFTSSGEFVFIVGKNVNASKVAEGGATQAEKNICTAVSGDICEANFEAGSGPNEFTSPGSLAVDPTGVVWVGNTNRLSSFDASGTAGAEIALPGAGRIHSQALDSAGNFYVVSESLAGVRKLEAGTGALQETLDAAGFPRAVAVDEADNLYVGDCGSSVFDCPSYSFKIYNAAGEQFSQFGVGQVIGAPKGNAIGVGDSVERLYAASSGTNESDSAVQAFPLPEPGPLVVLQVAEDLEPTTATLAATINPEGEETTYHFEYGADESYGQSTPIQTLTAEDFESEDVEAEIEELIPNTTYHFRVVATNHCNPSVPAEECTTEGEDQTFTTLPAVLIDPQWATDVSSNSVDLHARMDPIGVEAEAWLEYGTSESYGQLIPLANLGDGFGPVLREASLTGLKPGTLYHYRFVARDVRDTVTYTVNGADHTFVTQLAGLGFELADDRAWELVSPPDKHGAKLTGGGENHLQASADGLGVAFQSYLSIEVNPEGNRNLEPSMNLARRVAGGSWRSKDITPPNDRVSPFALGNGTEYKLFNASLSEALVEPRSGTLLSPEASERTPYLRENTEPGVFRPLVTGKEPFANVPLGTEFGGDGNVPAVRMVAASPDLRHFVLVSAVPLVEDAPASGETLYEWSNGQLDPVSVLPAGDGGAVVNAPFAGSGAGSVRGAVSEDGSRVFWSTRPGGELNALYVRDTDAGESARLDVVQSEASGIGTVRPLFQGASADGRIVFFTDSQQLTEDASAEGFDLYRCELPSGSIASGCATLNRISIPTMSGENAEVEGIAAGIAEDGKAIYFVARGVLDEATNGFGDSAVSGEPNLYFWRQGEGARFIATLSEEDDNDWANRVGELGAAASPNVRYLTFMSQRSLTGYDSRDADTGEAAQEIFRYDSVTDELDCVSCNPSGSRPISAAPDGYSLVDPQNIWNEDLIAAVLPEPTRISLTGPSLYRPRAILDNGRVFFNAIDSLVPADSNGQWDVYQHEPTGTGDCSAASGDADTARSAGGCVSLISSGTAEEEAAFLDASETGDDVFFWTPAQLNETDTDQEVDVYDARVNGIPATLPRISECLGEACQPAAVAPNDATPASAAFKGQGNPKPRARKRCAKGKRLVRRKGKARCVVRKRARKGKASKPRRAHR